MVRKKICGKIPEGGRVTVVAGKTCGIEITI
jgi:hypothetical protein